MFGVFMRSQMLKIWMRAKSMPKRKLEKVKQVKEQARRVLGRLPRVQVIPNKKKDAPTDFER